jgi:thiamine-monophosphate kinase
LNEAGIIQLLRRQEAVNGIGIGDDAALLEQLPVQGESLVVASDLIAENTHFKLKWSSPVDLAYKLVETNVSDFYCKGVKPSYAVFQLAVAGHFLDQLKPFLNAVKKRLKVHGVQLLGGDTIRAERCLFGLTLLGSTASFVPRKSKSTIPSGSVLACLGEIGGSSLGLKDLKRKEKRSKYVKAYLRPKSQRPSAKILQEAYCSIDQSDSLIEALECLALENNVQLKLHIDRLPVPKGASLTARKKDLEFFLQASEDLAIISVFPSQLEQRIKELGFTVIGTVAKLNRKKKHIKLYFQSQRVREIDLSKTYQHFG